MNDRGFISFYVLIFSTVLFILIVSFGVYNQTTVSSSSQNLVLLQKQMEVKTAYERSLYMLGENISYSNNTTFNDIGLGYSVAFTETSKTTSPLTITTFLTKTPKDIVYTFFYDSSDDLTIAFANLPSPSTIRIYNDRGFSYNGTTSVSIPKASFYNSVNAYNNTNYGWFYMEVITTNATTDLSSLIITPSQKTNARSVWATITDSNSKTVLTKKINVPLASVALQACATGGYTCITTPAGLDDLRNHLNDTTVKYRLGADLDLSAYDQGDQKGWLPIGDITNKFQGILDGNGFKIKNLTMIRTTDYDGLFGNTNGAIFQNINLSNVNISGKSIVGSLAGYANAGSITSLNVSGSVTGSSDHVGGVIGNGASQVLSKINSRVIVSGNGRGTGGIVGTSNAEQISNSYATGNITGKTEVGGLFGWVLAGSQISHSYATGNVIGTSGTAPAKGAGGLVGNFQDNSTITDSYATGSVTGDYAGGLVGYVLNSGGIISTSYSAGAVSGTVSKGGLVGFYNTGLTVTNSFYDTNTSGQTDNDIRGLPKTTLQMQAQSTFTNFDFTNNWLLYKPNSSPRLTAMP